MPRVGDEGAGDVGGEGGAGDAVDVDADGGGGVGERSGVGPAIQRRGKSWSRWERIKCASGLGDLNHATAQQNRCALVVDGENFDAMFAGRKNKIFGETVV